MSTATLQDFTRLCQSLQLTMFYRFLHPKICWREIPCAACVHKLWKLWKFAAIDKSDDLEDQLYKLNCMQATKCRLYTLHICFLSFVRKYSTSCSYQSLLNYIIIILLAILLFINRDTGKGGVWLHCSRSWWAFYQSWGYTGSVVSRSTAGRMVGGL